MSNKSIEFKTESGSKYYLTESPDSGTCSDDRLYYITRDPENGHMDYFDAVVDPTSLEIGRTALMLLVADNPKDMRYLATTPLTSLHQPDIANI